jgi:hypothetical protein
MRGRPAERTTTVREFAVGNSLSYAPYASNPATPCCHRHKGEMGVPALGSEGVS